jgi:hypothetical protein
VRAIIFSKLFYPEGDPILFVDSEVRHTTRFHLSTIKAWYRLIKVSFMIPNPFRSFDGRRNADNIKERFYLVIEFDWIKKLEMPLQEKIELQMKIAQTLARTRGGFPTPQLRMLVYSGNESVHLWFSVRGWTEHEVKAFFAEAKKLNVDPALIGKAQLVRMPGGTNHKTGNRQEVLYLNIE